MLYYVPIYSKLADAAEDEDVLEFYAFREVILGFSRVTLYGFTLFVFLSFGIETALRYTFYLTAAATALMYLAYRIIE
jgi:hypothetical protein